MHNRRLIRIILVLYSLLVLALPAFSQAAEPPEYLKSFDPAKGFKPAQSDLTEIFLQIAGSLEYYGSPEPYLRHMKAEHARIEAKYQQRFGTRPKSYCPAYMTDGYFEKFAETWKILSPKLGLESLTRNTGNLMCDAINGTRGNGTMLVEIFNRHQARVYSAMAGKGNQSSDFDALKSELIACLELDKTTINGETYAIARRDAVGFTVGIHGDVLTLFKKLDASLKPADAERIKSVIVGFFTDVGRMAQSELEAGIAEHALDRQTAAE